MTEFQRGDFVMTICGIGVIFEKTDDKIKIILPESNTEYITSINCRFTEKLTPTFSRMEELFDETQGKKENINYSVNFDKIKYDNMDLTCVYGNSTSYQFQRFGVGEKVALIYNKGFNDEYREIDEIECIVSYDHEYFYNMKSRRQISFGSNVTHKINDPEILQLADKVKYIGSGVYTDNLALKNGAVLRICESGDIECKCLYDQGGILASFNIRCEDLELLID